MEDVKEAFNSTLKERFKSPLYGAFIVSWLVINWKIFIVLFFSSSEELGKTKHQYISDNLVNFMNCLILPLISTMIIIALIPWLSELAFRLRLYFEKRKHKVESDSKMKDFFKHEYHKEFDSIATVCTYSIPILDVTSGSSSITNEILNYYVAHEAIEIDDTVKLTPLGKEFLKELYVKY
jgi:hypothetical protein